jgi:hypothetical protein
LKLDELELGAAEILTAALGEARERGVNRAAQNWRTSDAVRKPNINRKEYAHAIYPSVAQIFFFAVTRVTQSIPGLPYTACGVSLGSEEKKDYGHDDLRIGRSTPGERR